MKRDGWRAPAKVTRHATPGMRERSFNGTCTIMWSLDEALREFLEAPCAAPRILGAKGGGWTNGGVIRLVMGFRGTDVRDAACFDAVSVRYGVRAETFRDAFRAACPPYAAGHRDWMDLDITTLRDCHPAFAVLALPAWVEEIVVARQYAEHLERMAG